LETTNKTNYDIFFEEQMKDPEIKAAYDALEPWYQRELAKCKRKIARREALRFIVSDFYTLLTGKTAKRADSPQPDFETHTPPPSSLSASQAVSPAH
jgi:hypothetical protein